MRESAAACQLLPLSPSPFFPQTDFNPSLSVSVSVSFFPCCALLTFPSFVCFVVHRTVQHLMCRLESIFPCPSVSIRAHHADGTDNAVKEALSLAMARATSMGERTYE